MSAQPEIKPSFKKSWVAISLSGRSAEKNISSLTPLVRSASRYKRTTGALKHIRTMPRRKSFLWLLLRQLLPRGFRRVRDYGLLQYECKRLVQHCKLVPQSSLLPSPRINLHDHRCSVSLAKKR